MFYNQTLICIIYFLIFLKLRSNSLTVLKQQNNHFAQKCNEWYYGSVII